MSDSLLALQVTSPGKSAEEVDLKKGEGKGTEEETPRDGYKRHRVFINHVDSYHSKYIAAYLTDQIYGLSKIVQPTGEEALGEGEEAPITSPETKADLPTDKYEIIGTLTVPEFSQPTEDIFYTIEETEKNFRDEILRCHFIIYDITKNSSEISKALKTLSMLAQQMEEIKKIGPKTYEQFNEIKIFILISTVMTWALTKPLDPDDTELPFSEIDYRKRRPHPNYKEHYNCEKEVIKIGQKYKDKLKTYVIATGITYGEEEDILDFFFKSAWYNEVLPIFDAGNNKVPFIHVRDLAKALHGLMENEPFKPQYILAVEQRPTTLKQFVKSLSKALSDGKVSNIVAEEAFLYKNMTQTIFDRCTVNLNMEPVFLGENLQLQWQSEMNITENMNQIVQEFKTKRNLRPVKIVIHGPPASGKTTLAKKFCEYYNCKYVSIETMLEDFLQIWRESLIKPEKPKFEDTEYLGEEEIDEEIEEEDDPQQILDQIRETEILMEGGLHKIPDNYIIGLLRAYLAKNFCLNRGYVLDGYPQLTVQAKELFGQGGEGMGGEEEEEVEMFEPSKIFPDLVVGLEASDEFITQRLMKLPEEVIKDTPHAEERIYQRLETFREQNTEDNTVLNYFDELEIDIVLLEVKDDMEDEFSIIVNKLGAPSTFGLSPEEEEELHRIEEEEKKLAQEKDELLKRMELEKAEEERKNKMEVWSETLEKLQMEEEKILVAQSEPLRHYLMKYVFPTLTKGLLEVASIKPEDSVDFLAEYLFKENPEGRIFDPSYSAEGESLYGEFRGYIEKIINENDAFSK